MCMNSTHLIWKKVGEFGSLFLSIRRWCTAMVTSDAMKRNEKKSAHNQEFDWKTGDFASMHQRREEVRKKEPMHVSVCVRARCDRMLTV